MNEIDPSLRYSREKVKQYQIKDMLFVKQGELNKLAARIADEYRRDTIAPSMLAGIIRALDITAIFGISLVIAIIYVGINPSYMWPYPLVSIGAALLFVLFAEIADCYETHALRLPGRWLPRVLISLMVVFAIIALAGFFLKASGFFSRVWFGSWFLLATAYMIASRGLLSHQVRKWARNGRMERRTVIVGGGEPAKKLIRALETQQDSDIRICGIFDDRDDLRSPPIVAGYPKLGTINELVEFTRRARIDMLIVALPFDAEDRVLTMLKKLWVLPVDIRLSAHAKRLRFRPRTYSFIGSVPMLDIFDKPIRDWDSVAKRLFDIFFSLIGIFVMSPIMLATAIAIKATSKGPVIFKQQRHGFNNEIINVYKFRSMYVDQCDPTARAAVSKGDPRVTPVGRFIRKTSIDELPQFFNALFGDLSLVGPRPHAVHAQTPSKLYGEVVDGYFARHRVKPGVTGWAQINGWRGEIDHDEKIHKRTEFDLYYIENWSLLFDLKILFLTPVRLFNTENAY